MSLLHGVAGAAPRSSAWLIAGTSSRIVAAPVVMALVLAGDDEAAAIVFVVVALTDVLDGHLARRWGVTTTLGSFLDTTADKLLVSTVLMALVAVDRVSPWLAMLIVARELAILGLRGTVAATGVVFSPSPGAKAKTAVQFLAMLLAILRPDVSIGPAYLDEWAMIVATIVTVATGIDYLVRFAATLRS